MLFGISQLQIAFPLLFKDVLTNYLEVIEYVMNNAGTFGNEYTLRAAVICLTSIIKCYLYYSNDVMLLQKRKIEHYDSFQKEAFDKYHAFFTVEKIEALFQLFLINLLPRRSFISDSQNIENLEELIEIDDEQTIDEYEKLDSSLYNLTLACTMAILVQFSSVAIPVIHSICLKVVKKEVALPSSAIQDGLFSIIGLLPVVYRKKNIAPADYLDFEAVLLYLQSEGRSDINLAKRIPILIMKWLNLFYLEMKVEVIKLVIEITRSLDNTLIKYECCMCLKAALEGDVKIALDYITISEQLVPVIIDLLHKFINPQIIWALIDLLKILFTKVQYLGQNVDIIKQIQNLGIEALIKLDNDPILHATAEMLKTVIASFPGDTDLHSIYVLALQFIDSQLSKGQAKIYVLSLWLFITKELTATQRVDDPMKVLFGKYLDTLINLTSPYELSMTINIVEEYLLAGLLSSDNYESIVKVIENTYSQTVNLPEPSEEVFEVKAATLGLTTSFILTLLESKNEQNLSVLENTLGYIIKDILSDYTGPPCRAFRVFRASILTITNRFIVINLAGISEILQKLKIDYYTFIEYWIKLMNTLSSKPSMRINTLAILQIVPQIGYKEVLLKVLNLFLKHTIPEVEGYIESGGQPPNMGYQHHVINVNDRIRDIRDSERKKTSRTTQLYFDVNLQKIFVEVFKGAVTKHGLSLDEIAASVNDEGLLKRFLLLIEN